MVTDISTSHAQHEVEVILLKQLASYLAVPIFVVDPTGDLVYYNEPAESLLGRRYDETGEMPMAEWSTIFIPTDDEGNPVPPDALPLSVALLRQEPDHQSFWIRGLDNQARRISVSAFPVIGQHDRHLGAVAMFWEQPRR